jgi:methylmalonyl-CoA mutase cobalamin-binding subunit
MGTRLRSFENAGGKAPSLPHVEANRAKPAWTELLNEAIETAVLPRMATKHPFTESPAAGRFSRAEIAAFVALVMADDMARLRGVAEGIIVQGGGRDALLHEVLAPAAHLLGEMWERDTCDFVTVTLGIYRLDQLMKETAFAGQGEIPINGFDHRILLLPAPGEQHSFGVGLVADTFRQGGWCVHSGPAVGRAQLLRLVRQDWFDVIGFAVSSDRWLKGLPACIRAVRAASCNRGVFIMVGGPAILNHCERTRFLGADGTAPTAHEALAQANLVVAHSEAALRQQSKTRLVDAG